MSTVLVPNAIDLGLYYEIVAIRTGNENENERMRKTKRRDFILSKENRFCWVHIKPQHRSLSKRTALGITVQLGHVP